MAHPYKSAESAKFVIQLFKTWEEYGWRPITLPASAGMRPTSVKQKVQNGFYWLIENLTDETVRETWRIHQKNTKLNQSANGVTFSYKMGVSELVMTNLDGERLQLRASLDRWMRGTLKQGDSWPSYEIQIPLTEDDYSYFTDVLMRERANGFTALIDRTTQRILFSYQPLDP